MNIFLIILVCALILALGLTAKRLNAGGVIILIPLGVAIYIALGKGTFFLSAGTLAVIYLFITLLKFFSKSAYNAVFEDKSPTLTLGVHVGLLFLELSLLVLTKSTYDGMFTGFGFVKLAFYTTLATSASLALSRTTGGFATTGINIVTNKKTLPFEKGSITIIGAVSAFFVCFAIAIIYYFIAKSAITACICCLLSFVGYVLNALICAKFQTTHLTLQDDESATCETPSSESTPSDINPTEPTEESEKDNDNSAIEQYPPKESTEKRKYTVESNSLSLAFISILIPTIIAIIIGLIIN